MTNKKAMGLHWYILLMALFVSIGILYFSIGSVNIPNVGDFSINIIKTSEKNSLIPTLIEEIMNWINEQTIVDLDENKIFKLRSYCNSDYEERLRLRDSKQLLIGGFEALEGNNSFCIIDEDDLVHYFEMIFEADYNEFRSRDFGEELDLSNTIYTSSVKKENDEYSNIVNTSNGIEIPINTKKKQIGKIIMKPVFKIPVDYAFDDPEKERCILSVDCGADCDDVIAKYSEIEFRKKSHSCSDYFFCTDAFSDDFGLEYPCEANFCMETGAYASCSNAADDIVCPDCCCTPWAAIGCDGDEMQYERECKLGGCDEETYSEYDCACDSPCYCDPCCFDYGSDCGPCGHDSCEEEEEEEPEPEPPGNGDPIDPCDYGMCP